MLQIFQRTRAFNLVQLVDFLSERFSAYYVRRLLDFASNRKQRVAAKFPPYTGQQVRRISEDIYDVASSKKDGTIYSVNMATVMCTCADGSSGKICKHVHYVLTESQDASFTIGYNFCDNRNLFYEVATGNSAPSGWLDLLHGGVNQSNASSVPSVAAQATVDMADTGIPSEGVVVDKIDELEQRIAKVDEAFKARIHEVARQNPDVLLDAYDAFLGTLQSLSTPNAIASAMHTFGKYSGGGKRAGKRLSCISVQSTAIARRKKVLRGKHPGEAGRPRKSAVVIQNMHDYSMPSRKQNQPASHALAKCVSRNTSLGNSHSKK